jgi:signal transduction histidine kinase
LQNANSVDVAGARVLKAAMVGAVCLVFGLAYVDLLREQQRALDDFTAEQSSLAHALAGTLEARMQDVVGQLSAAAELPDDDRLAAFLRQLVQGNPVYREADVVDARGRVLLAVPASAARTIDDSPALRQAREHAIHESANRLSISGPLRRSTGTDERERLRMFARSADGRTLVFLIDISRFFDGLSAAQNPAPMRWLILDDGRRWIDFAPTPLPAARWQIDDTRVPADVRRLLDEMASGRDGAAMLDRPAAAALGLEQRRAVAGFAPLHLAPDRTWSIAVVASARRVRDRARVSAWRLGASTGVAALLVGLFGLFIGRQQHRARALGEALRIAEATAALRERSEKIVESIPIGVLTLDERMRVVAANPYLSSRGIAGGIALPDALAGATPDERAMLEVVVAEARKTRRPVMRAGVRLHLDGAEPRDVDVYAIPLERPLPDADCFLVLHDRTEMRLLERSLARAEKLATIGTLAAGVAHEVGTPLGIISGRAEQLLSRVPEGDGAEPTRKALTSILGQVDKVSTTIRQLLDFARVRPVEATNVSPAHILQTAASLLEHRFRQAKVQLTVDAPATVPMIQADAGQLEQVFVNLLINAADACSAGGHVRAVASRRGDRVWLEVVDDGCGIAEEHLPHVLDPFFTTKKRGQGTGLGLSIAADIVKNHGGQLEIASTAQKGTRVSVQLPITKELT